MDGRNFEGARARRRAEGSKVGRMAVLLLGRVDFTSMWLRRLGREHVNLGKEGAIIAFWRMAR